MRWNSKVEHAELTPVQTWRFKDDGNFGGRSLLTPDSNTLSHHGVPGMRWGIKTKEYVKKGYDTLKRRQAIQKMKRKAEAKAQFQEGYNRGQRVASNTYFIKNRVNSILEKKNEGEKKSLSDRAVDKMTDFALKKTGLGKEAKKYGLDRYIPMAKDFLKQMKDEKIDNLYEDLQTEEGQKRAQKFASFMTQGVYQRYSRVHNLVKQGGRAVSKAVLNKASKSAKELGAAAKAGIDALRKVDIKDLSRNAGDSALNKFADFLWKKRRGA